MRRVYDRPPTVGSLVGLDPAGILVALDLGRLLAGERHQAELRQMVSAQVEGERRPPGRLALRRPVEVARLLAETERVHALVEGGDLEHGLTQIADVATQGVDPGPERVGSVLPVGTLAG